MILEVAFGGFKTSIDLRRCGYVTVALACGFAQDSSSDWLPLVQWLSLNNTTQHGDKKLQLD
jgi:hypothetical protein